jgi:hypothetical protein
VLGAIVLRSDASANPCGPVEIEPHKRAVDDGVRYELDDRIRAIGEPPPAGDRRDKVEVDEPQGESSDASPEEERRVLD